MFVTKFNFIISTPSYEIHYIRNTRMWLQSNSKLLILPYILQKTKIPKIQKDYFPTRSNQLFLAFFQSIEKHHNSKNQKSISNHWANLISTHIRDQKVVLFALFALDRSLWVAYEALKHLWLGVYEDCGNVMAVSTYGEVEWDYWMLNYLVYGDGKRGY